MAPKTEKHVYTIPPDASLLDALAAGVWSDAGQDALKLSAYLILLPTRRACRALREAFLRVIDGKAALLPRMQPLGDIDEEELYFSGANAAIDIPPAITPLRRQLLLTQLVRQKNDGMSFDQAAQLAKALGEFLDQVQIERCDMNRLGDLVETKELAKHWEETVAFLEILTKAWPKVLSEEGCIDPADRRNRILQTQAAVWRASPPKHPIIAAGSTGSIPATAELLSVIASLSAGAVILPGLDMQLAEEAWQVIGETHPQFGMKCLLDSFEIERAAVKLWPACKNHKSAPRLRLLNESMRPAQSTEVWRSLSKTDIPADAFKNLALVELDHPQEEAQVIALRIRQALEDKQKTVALVTPDRMLAERVAAMLRRWDIEANDSAGVSLATQPVGSFLSDILEAVSPNAGAVDYLSLLKHPFTACGSSLIECRTHARDIEISVWRSEKPGQSEWLKGFHKQLQPLASVWRQKLPLTEWLQRHTELAEALATTDVEKGADRLWREEAGGVASEWLDDWRLAATNFPALTGDEYAGLFSNLLRSVTVRTVRGLHPRISILGPLEARLIHADVRILGALNEGVWPPEPAIDPWMSRPMKADFGLPSPELRIGLSAHDFVQLASTSEVFLTRSKRAGNAPTVPSRFLLQLNAVMRALGYSDDKQDGLNSVEPWQEWGHLLDAPQKIAPCVKPEPKPSLKDRPKTLRVTDIGMWRRNPYAIYARYILGLRKLDPLDAEVDASDQGSMIHDALDKFIKTYPDELPANAEAELLKIGQEMFTAYDEHPEVKAFWWPRFQRIAAWLIAHEIERRSKGTKPVKAEASGQIMLGDFVLKGRADRIDRKADDTLAIVDYKTGSVPNAKDVQSGCEPQLPLLACIAEQGGFAGVEARAVGEIAYWKLNGGRNGSEEQIIGKKTPPKQLADEARIGLENLIKIFAQQETPYRAVPKPNLQPRYDDYAHLARLAEWGRTSEDT